MFKGSKGRKRETDCATIVSLSGSTDQPLSISTNPIIFSIPLLPPLLFPQSQHVHSAVSSFDCFHLYNVVADYRSHPRRRI